jgi:hypothetical protein
MNCSAIACGRGERTCGVAGLLPTRRPARAGEAAAAWRAAIAAEVRDLDGVEGWGADMNAKPETFCGHLSQVCVHACIHSIDINSAPNLNGSFFSTSSTHARGKLDF